MEHYLYKQANALLNQVAIDLSGDTASFLVHYWGVVPKHYDNHVHRHSFFEVCYVMHGEGNYSDHDCIYPLSTGTMFISRPGIWHQIRSDTGLALFFVAFEVIESKSSLTIINQFNELAENMHVVIPDAQSSPSVQIFNAILGLVKSGAPANEDMYRHLCHSLLKSFLYLFKSQSVTTGDLTIQDTSGSRLMHRAKLYIDDNLSSSLHLKHIAQYLNISERHLSRLFLQHLGQSFIHYLQEKRVQKSVEMLMSSEMAVKEIAKIAGFESVHYFTRVFTNKIGVSPAKFRKTQFSDNLKPRK
ncbi:AraC family transcriptional regulator [Paenibacillus cremeus]|uniref:Helix-turn-helix domain-containing protein n=1 Tax=Paenibacillus cremeus TaxID=2163881 RepID=A0A559K777_9BACL|nr:AraC family transcriptional regulator [Paenibacillus cremeus]TVY07992.1 helix-turn-helix domain-containing protein [Paenibacillus cremeus]